MAIFWETVRSVGNFPKSFVLQEINSERTVDKTVKGNADFVMENADAD